MDKIIVAHSGTAGARPPSGSRRTGELYVNRADGVLGFIDAGGDPVDLTFGAVPVKPNNKSAFLIIDPAGFPAWLEIDVDGIVARPSTGINQTIQVQHPAAVPLTLRGHADQVADLFRLRTAADARRFDVTPGGVARITGPAAGMLELAAIGGATRKLGVTSGRVTIDGALDVTELRIVGSTTRTLSVDGSTLVANGQLRVQSNIFVENSAYIDGNCYIHSPSGGSAQLVMRTLGGSNRGIAYAADDGSYVRLLKYTSSGSFDVYLNLVEGDCRLVSASSGIPSLDSLLTQRRLGNLPVGNIGTYAWLVSEVGGHGPGDLRSGSGLRYTHGGQTGFDGPSPPGTWRCMGDQPGGGTAWRQENRTVWLRIS